jgi:hypothetical protein
MYSDSCANRKRSETGLDLQRNGGNNQLRGDTQGNQGRQNKALSFQAFKNQMPMVGNSVYRGRLGQYVYVDIRDYDSCLGQQLGYPCMYHVSSYLQIASY